MNRSNVATRRFYSAFYQWSLLTSPAPACQHVAKTPLLRRRQCSYASYGGGYGQRGRGHGRRAFADVAKGAYSTTATAGLSTNARPARQERARTGPDGALNRPKKLQIPRAFTAFPVTPGAEWATHEFEPWDFAVRARDEKAQYIVVELAVPVPSAQHLDSKWGVGLERMATEFDVSIKCSSPLENPQNVDRIPLHTVLLSGKYGTVAQAFDAHRRTMFVSPTAIAVPRSSVTRLSNVLQKYGITPYVERPLSTMPAGVLFIRESREDEVTVHIAVQPESLKSAIDRYGSLDYISRRSGARVEVSETAHSEVDDIRGAPIASVLVTGTLVRAQLATDYVLGMQSIRVKAVRHGLVASHNNPAADARTQPAEAAKASRSLSENTATPAPQLKRSYIPRAFLAQPVHTLDDWPLNEFEPWDVAIRARDLATSHITTQQAVPAGSIRFLQSQFGSNLETLAANTGVSIACSPTGSGHLSDIDQEPIGFVTISGPINAVRQASDRVSSSAFASVQVKPVNKESGSLISRALETTGVQSAADLPLSDIGFWQFAIREASGDTVTVQMVVKPEDLEATMARYRGLHFIERRTGARVTLGETVQSMRLSSRDGSVVASITITGNIEQAQLAAAFVRGMRHANDGDQSPAEPGNGSRSVEINAKASPKPAQLAPANTRTSAEHPFEDMKAWECVTRFHSDSGVMQEAAVPYLTWERLQGDHGKDLTDLVRKLGGRVSARHGADLDASTQTRSLVPVLISGTHREAKSLWSALMGMKGVLQQGNSYKERSGRDQPRQVSHESSPGQRVFRPAELQMPPVEPTQAIRREPKTKSGHDQPRHQMPIEATPRRTADSQEDILLRMQDRLDKVEPPLAANKPDQKTSVADLPASPPSAANKAHDRHTVAASPQLRDQEQSTTQYSPPTAPTPQAQHDPKANIDYAQLAASVKQLMRQLTHPVVAITTRTADIDADVTDLSHLRGVTVSSFNTVTMHPKPLISFNLKTPSRTWDAMQQTAMILVHVLAANPAGAAIAQGFTVAREDAHQPFVALQKLGVDVFNNPKNARRPPELTQRGAIIARIRIVLDLEKCVRLGDHVIVVGEVAHVREMPSNVGFDEGALAYSQQGYRELGEVVEPMTEEDAFMVDDETEEEVSAEDLHPRLGSGAVRTGVTDSPFTAGNPAQQATVAEAGQSQTSERPALAGGQTQSPAAQAGNSDPTGTVSDRYFDVESRVPTNAVNSPDAPDSPSSAPAAQNTDTADPESAPATSLSESLVRRVSTKLSSSSSAYGPRQAISLGSGGKASAKPDVLENILMDAERRGEMAEKRQGGRRGGDAQGRTVGAWGLKA